ncbi:MAG: hypothetical protein HY888_05480 [Deltaproteobacteria bacterium]|nr:hypothetical protein [Deltaproteobacteria bacterium]
MIKAENETVIPALLAILMSLTIVLYFSPTPHSVWGVTFFGIKYSLAIWVVPVSSGVITAIVFFYMSKRPSLQEKCIRTGALGGLMSFIGYALVHTALAVLTGMPFDMAPVLLLMIFEFGGVLFLPLSLILGITGLLAARKLNHLKN